MRDTQLPTLSGAEETVRPGRPFAIALLVLVLTLASVVWAGASTLAPGDEQLSSGEYFDRVTFSGAAGDVVAIELTSSEFDPYLIIIDSNEQVVAQEDDSPGMGLGVRLTFTLPSTGQFTLIVTSALPGETGGYHLSMSTPGQIGKAPSSTPTAPSQPAITSQVRSVSGTVIDSLGRPISGAIVDINPALTTGHVRTTTDANGRYVAEGLIDVPYHAYAWAYVEYNGRQICLRLGMESPTDYNSFVPIHGIQRNFVMQFSGFMGVERDPDYQFGGTLKIHYAYAYRGNGNRFEVSFTPTGPIIDGTTAAPFTRTIDPETESVHSVPPGPYVVTVTLVGRDGSRTPLRVKHASDYWGDHHDSVAIDWTGDGDCDYGTGLDWAEIYVEFPED